MNKEWELIQKLIDGEISVEQFHQMRGELWAEEDALTAARFPSEKITKAESVERFRTRTRTHEIAFAKTGGRCFYCGASESRQLEHKIPRSRGGKTDAENCVIACATCNNRKGTRTLEEFRIHLMIVDGRAPSAFHGEAPSIERDWLIVGSPRIRAVAQPYSERLAAHAGMA